MNKSIYAKMMGGTAGMFVMLTAHAAAAQTTAPATTPPADATTAQAPADAAAPTNEQVGVKDIIVTAQRKSERLQDVPISVNVVSGDTLETRGGALSTDLPSLVPALTFNSVAGAGTPYLRGVGSNAANPNDEPSVATYVDGVYIASPYANILNLANLDRIEVLKGPQGTLFGRNATGGVIQLITKDPSLTSTLFEATGGYANYNTYSGSAYLSVPIADTLAVDFTAQGSKQNNGYGYNVTTKQPTFLTKDYSFRSKILFEPSDGFRMVLAGDYASITSNFADYRLPAGAIGADGQPAPSNPYDTRDAITTVPGITDPTPQIQNKQYGVSLTTTADVGIGRLVTILAYRHQDGYYHAEADATPLSLVAANLPTFQKNISGEIQLVSKAESKVDWTVGAYYYNNDAGYVNYVFVVPSVPAPLYGTTLQKTESISGYAQATVEVLPKLKITGGVRYTDERQTLFGSVGLLGIFSPIAAPQLKRGYDEPTYRASIDYEFAHDIHGYGSFNRGVKGGGFDVLSVFNVLGGAAPTGFNPEFLNAYEIGFKTKLFDNRLRFNAAGFYYDYSNIQVQVIPAGATSAGVVQTTNAASATIKGIDVDFELVPVRNLSFSGGFAYVDGKYGSFPNTVSYGNSAGQIVAPYDASGNPTVRTPKFTGNLTTAYTIDSNVGTFPLAVTVSHNSGYSFGSDNILRNNAYTLLNASAGWVSNDGRFGITAFGKNLTNKYYLSQGVPSALGALTVPAAPRTYGLTFRVKYGYGK